VGAFLKVDCIMFYVSDLVAATEFYEMRLGMRRAWSDSAVGMVGLRFPAGDSELVLHNDPDIPSPDFCFLVSDVDELCAEYGRAGLTVIQPPIDVRTGRYAVLADLEGNRLPIIDLSRFGGVPRYEHK
jgi:predicted enzyme related to lactoylglutathione lyase